MHWLQPKSTGDSGASTNQTHSPPTPSIHVRLGAPDNRVIVGNNTTASCNIYVETATAQVTIGSNSFIGTSDLICAEKINVGDDVLIAWGVTIIDNDSHSIYWPERAQDAKQVGEILAEGGNASTLNAAKNWAVVDTAPIDIADKSWIGAHAIITKGVTIGEGAVVATGSVVTRDVPAWSLVAGNPATVKKTGLQQRPSASIKPESDQPNTTHDLVHNSSRNSPHAGDS